MAQLRQEVDPGEAGLDAKALDRLDQHVAHYVDEGRLPGFLLAVARGGRVAHLTTHGRRDVAADLPVEADTLWRIYSMTKPVTTVAALILVEEGRLSLDDPVARHLPAFADPQVYESGSGTDVQTRPATQPLLIRHLLTHTAGLTFAFYRTHPVDALYRAAGLDLGGAAGLGPGRDRRGVRPPAAAVRAGHTVELLGRHQCARQSDRGRVRAAARRVLRRARLRPARHDRRGLLRP